MKILRTKQQLRYTQESAKRLLFEPPLPPPPICLTTLDPSTVLHSVLSNGNLTITADGALSNDQGASVGSANLKTGGKFYFEVTVVGIQPGGWSYAGFGVCRLGADFYNLGNDGTGGAILENGYLYNNGTSYSGALSLAQGDVVGVLADLDDRQIQFIGVSGSQVGISTPVIPLLSGALVPFGSLSSPQAGDAMTFNFGATPFVGALPAGYLPGWCWGTYVAPLVPVITLVTANTGSSAGGDTVIITGLHFTGVDTVWFGQNYSGGIDAESFTVNSDTQITAVSPPGAGTVDVRVSGPGGMSAIVTADQYTYVNVAVWWPEQVMDWDVQIAGSQIYSAFTTGNTLWIGMNSLSAPTRQIDDGHWADLYALDPMANNWAASYYRGGYSGIIGAMLQDANYIYWVNDTSLVISRLPKSASTFAALQTLVITAGAFVDGSYTNDNGNDWGSENCCIGPDGKLYIAWSGAWNGGTTANKKQQLVVVDLAAWSPTGVSAYVYETVMTSGVGPQGIAVTANGTVIIAQGDGITVSTAAYYYAHIGSLSSWTKVAASFAFRDYMACSSGNLAFFCQNTGNTTANLRTKVAKIDVSSGFTETVIDLQVQDPNFGGHGQAGHCKTIWCSGTHFFAFGPRLNGGISAPYHAYLGRFLLPNLTADGGKFWSQLVYNEYDQVAQAGYWDSNSGKVYMSLEAFQEERNGFFICNEDLSSPQFYAPTPTACASAPVNNAFANRVNVITGAAPITYDCTYANQETNEPVSLMWASVINSDQNDLIFNNTHSLWFTWTPAATGTYCIRALNDFTPSTSGNPWPGYMIGVYTGTALGSLSWVTGSRGTPNGAPSIKNINATGGQTYNFFVGYSTGNDFFGGAISAGESDQADFGKFHLDIATVTDVDWSATVFLCDFDTPGPMDVGPISHGMGVLAGYSQLLTDAIWTGNASLSSRSGNAGGCYWPFSADWQLGSGPFTIEAWVWWVGPNSTNSLVVGQWSANNANLGWRLYINSSTGNQIFFDVSLDGVTITNVLNGSGLLNNSWIHIVVDFNGSTYNLFVNGTIVATSTTPRSVFASTLPLSIGQPRDDYGGTQMVRGNIDGVRITKGLNRYAGQTVDTTAGDLPRNNINQPLVGSLKPAAGAAAGGTSVVIKGLSFTGATAVKFGSTNAASFTVNSDSQITATSPALALGTYDVSVTTPIGTSVVSPADKYTYNANDPSWTNVVLLLGFEDVNASIAAPGFSDESLSAHGVLSGGGTSFGPMVSTSFSMFGVGAFYDNGNSGAWYADSTDWALGSGNFTVELWFCPINRPGVTTGTQFLVCQFGANAPNLGWVLYLTNGQLAWNVSTTGSDNLNDLTASVALTPNVFSHCCVDYDGTTYRLYVNGAVMATSTTARNIFHPVGQKLAIGSNSALNAWWLYGFIDELRITKGVARYHGTFTVPTTAFPRH